MLNKRLGMRSCSELISTLKAGCQPQGAEVVGHDVFEMRVVLASFVTMAGPSLHAWARGEGSSGVVMHQQA